MASSNLFKSLYSRDNSYQSSGYVCQSAIDESETSFDISGNAGVITDSNGNTLSSIDLSEIHVGDLSQYNTETRILQPHSCYVLQGQEYGLARTTYYFELPEDITSIDGFGEYLAAGFDIIYNQHNHVHMHCEFTVEENRDFIEAINQYFETYELPVVASIQKLKCLCDPTVTKDYVVFEAHVEGYFYFIKNFRVEPAVQSEDYPDSPFFNGVEDMKFLVWETIMKHKPDPQTDPYEVPCELYSWILENHEDLINLLPSYKSFLDYWNEYYNNTFSEEEQEEIFNKYTEYANAAIADTIYDSPVIADYDIVNHNKVYDIITDLSQKIIKANQRYSQRYWLPEISEWRVPMMKYPNGAFKGIVIIPDYPDDEQYDLSTLYINHIQTTVNVMLPVHEHHGETLYKKETFGVMSNAMFPKEKHHTHNDIKVSGNMQLQTDICDGWDKADIEIDDDFGAPCREDCRPDNNDFIYLGESCYSDKERIMGVFRYMDYVTENHQWLKIGDGYLALGKDDDPQSVIPNLLNSVMIYNPNDIPVRIKYMIFS